MAGTMHQLLSCGFVASTKEEEEWKKRKSCARNKDVLWKEFFRDPSRWCDYRNSKSNPRYPDFKHKDTKEPLWMDSWDNPSWVAEELRSRGFVGDDGSPPAATALTLSPVDAFVASLRSCTKHKDLDRGTRIHDDLLQRGLLEQCSDALVTMYATCGELRKAKALLDMCKSSDVITWTALIAGYAREGQAQQALDCFERMQHEGILPDAVAYTCILKACATIGASDKGKEIHDEIARQGFLNNNIVLGGALVDMYAKCGAFSIAQCVLEELPSRNVVCWSALISGYAQGGQAEQALDCFKQMQREGIRPNAVTYACILKACATVGAADKGKQIHEEIARQGLLQDNIVLGNALVDMYAKCGALSTAQHVLEELPSRDVVSWNAMIAGYVQDCQVEHALSCFEQMQHEGILPDLVTFACVLNLCNHLGLVEESQSLFINMNTKYDVKPDLEFYTCMVDLFGRAGHLEKAVRLIQEMPTSNYSVVWRALLGSCQNWGDINVGKWAFEQAVQLDKSDATAYILMSNIYAAAGMQVKARSIEAMRIRNKAWKSRNWRTDASNIARACSVWEQPMNSCEAIRYCS